MDAQAAQALQTYASITLTALTAITLVVLIKYTRETVRLRRSAQDQTTVTASLLKEAQRQNEQSLLPIIALSLQWKPVDVGHMAPDDWVEPPPRRRFLLLRNIGNGAAFNVAIRPVSGDTLLVSFHHSDHLAAGEESIATPILARKDQPLSGSGLGDLEQAARSREIELPHRILVSYKNVSGAQYSTTQDLRNDATTGELIVPFDQSERVEGE